MLNLRNASRFLFMSFLLGNTFLLSHQEVSQEPAGSFDSATLEKIQEFRIHRLKELKAMHSKIQSFDYSSCSSNPLLCQLCEQLKAVLTEIWVSTESSLSQLTPSQLTPIAFAQTSDLMMRADAQISDLMMRAEKLLRSIFCQIKDGTNTEIKLSLLTMKNLFAS